MRIPKRPPNFHELLGKEGSLDLLAKNHAHQTDDQYRHWDELRHRKPPGELTLNQWWLVTKFNRLAQLKPIVLTDTTGHPFQFAVPEPLLGVLHQIDLSMGGSIGVQEPITNPNTRNRYINRSLIEEAITSSQLEGAATTREVAKEMIITGRKPRDISERMILNNYATMQRIRELKGEQLTPQIVFEIHRIVTDGTLEIDDGAGRFRTADEERIVGDHEGEVLHSPPPSEQLDERLQNMCAFANAPAEPFVHPAIRSIILHFWLAYDHPFVDGNGRTARALFYWSMLSHGYWLFEFVSISSAIKKAPIKYGRSFLFTETDDNDLTYFIVAQAKLIQQAIADLHGYIDRKSDEARESQKQIRALDFVNHRQAALLVHALGNPGAHYTIEGHRSTNSVVYQTARNDIVELEKLGLLYSRRVGKKNIFHAEADLPERLGALNPKPPPNSI